MGLSQSFKDPSINVYIAFKKTFYYAGEIVQGIVHVNCMANRPYVQLLLRLQGKERVHWRQSKRDGDDEVTTDYDNSRETYNHSLYLNRFPNGIRKGQFSFPFSMLLPAAFPANFQLGQRNYIKYTLSAIFVPFHNGSQSPIYQRFLHIREPPRLPLGQVGFRIREMAAIQLCCCDSGQVELTLQSEVSYFTSGQTFRVLGSINNVGGTDDIGGFRIILREATMKATERGEYKTVSPQKFILHQSLRHIPIGRNHQFDLPLRVPVQGITYTAVGNIIYRAYFLELEAEVGGIYKNPKISRHVIVNSDIEPAADEHLGVQVPAVWNPEVLPPVAFLSLQPYVYQPHRLIDVRNQSGVPNQGRNMNRNLLANKLLQ